MFKEPGDKYNYIFEKYNWIFLIAQKIYLCVKLKFKMLLVKYGLKSNNN